MLEGSRGDTLGNAVGAVLFPLELLPLPVGKLGTTLLLDVGVVVGVALLGIVAGKLEEGLVGARLPLLF